MLLAMGITIDTQTGHRADAQRGPHPRLTDAAVLRGRERLDVADCDSLAEALGLSRATFWRARAGTTPIRLADARRIAGLLNMPVDEAFEGGDDA